MFAVHATRTPFCMRYSVSLSVFMYAVITGCMRTATLAFTTVRNPVTGARTFSTQLTLDLDADASLVRLRWAAAAVLSLLGYACADVQLHLCAFMIVKRCWMLPRATLYSCVCSLSVFECIFSLSCQASRHQRTH